MNGAGDYPRQRDTTAGTVYEPVVCEVCGRAVPVYTRFEGGELVLMDFGLGRVAKRACRACILTGGEFGEEGGNEAG